MNSENAIPASAFILIGGKSERFGSPKWQVEISGETVLDRLWKACVIFESRFVVCKKQPGGLHRPFIQDALEIQSHIVGLYIGLKQTKHDWNLFLSCDLLLIRKGIIVELAAHISSDYEIMITETSGIWQTNCAFYRKDVKNICEKLIESKDFALHKPIKNVSAKIIDFSNKEELFLNINTPSDLQTAKKILEKN